MPYNCKIKYFLPSFHFRRNLIDTLFVFTLLDKISKQNTFPDILNITHECVAEQFYCLSTYFSVSDCCTVVVQWYEKLHDVWLFGD